MIDETIENQFMLMNFLIGLIFIIVISVILVSIIKGISEWNKNNNSPKLSVNAKVVTKRTSVQGGGETRAYNHYYVTFEVESGGRIEKWMVQIMVCWLKKITVCYNSKEQDTWDLLEIGWKTESNTPLLTLE